MLRYRLDDLGWHQFEQLCQATLKDFFGPGVLSWSGHSDRGRDAYSAVSLLLPPADRLAEPVVFQMKFVAGANAAGAEPQPPLMTAVKAELAEIASRREKGQWRDPGTYALLTNVELAPTWRTDIEDLIGSALGDIRILAWGGQDICDFLDRSTSLRMAYPQVLGLTDLDALVRRALNQALYERSSAQLEIAADLAPVFVPTEAYYAALNTLHRHAFAVLTGPPEFGKSTIGRTIGLVKASEGWEFLECRSSSEFFSSFQRDQPQLFMVDDAFGATEYRPDLALAWGDDLERVIRRLDRTHWLIWTSRPTPLAMALKRLHLQGLADQFPQPGEVMVDAEVLTIETKTLMLYRHCKHAELKPAAADVVRQYGRRIVEDRHFTPERIRRFAQTGLGSIVTTETSEFEIEEGRLDAAIELAIREPTMRMRNSFNLLGDNHKWLLFALLDAGDSFVTEANLKEAFVRHRGDSADVEELTADLREHFIGRTDQPTTARNVAMTRFSWKHPSWRDLVIERLMTIGNDRRRFLSHVSAQGFILAISSGGGPSGDRVRPLLQSADDWEVLGDRGATLVRSCSGFDLLRLLQTTTEALTGASGASHERLVAIAQELLKSCVQRWRADSEQPTRGVLGAFYTLAAEVGEPSPSLDIAPIWAAQTSSLADVVAAVDNDDGMMPLPEDVQRELDRFLGLARLLQDNAPSFLPSVDFPDSTADLVGRALEGIDRTFSYFDHPDRADDYDDRLETLDGAQSSAGDLIELVPMIAPTARRLMTKWESDWSDLQAEREREYPSEDDDDSHDAWDKTPSDDVSVEEILADL